MMKNLCAPLLLTLGSSLALAQNGKTGDDARWNITGPVWYDTPCGHQGFSVTHGMP